MCTAAINVNFGKKKNTKKKKKENYSLSYLLPCEEFVETGLQLILIFISDQRQQLLPSGDELLRQPVIRLIEECLQAPQPIVRVQSISICSLIQIAT